MTTQESSFEGLTIMSVISPIFKLLSRIIGNLEPRKRLTVLYHDRKAVVGQWASRTRAGLVRDISIFFQLLWAGMMDANHWAFAWAEIRGSQRQLGVWLAYRKILLFNGIMLALALLPDLLWALAWLWGWLQWPSLPTAVSGLLVALLNLVLGLFLAVYYAIGLIFMMYMLNKMMKQLVAPLSVAPAASTASSSSSNRHGGGSSGGGEPLAGDSSLATGAEQEAPAASRSNFVNVWKLVEGAVRAYGEQALEVVLLTLIGVAISYVPTFGTLLGIAHFALLYGFQAYETRWSLQRGNSRALRERHWIYLLGFGLPISAATFFCSFFVSSALFSLLFPIFITMTFRDGATPLRQRRGTLTFIPESISYFPQTRMLFDWFIRIFPSLFRLLDPIIEPSSSSSSSHSSSSSSTSPPSSSSSSISASIVSSSSSAASSTSSFPSPSSSSSSNLSPSLLLSASSISNSSLNPLPATDSLSAPAIRVRDIFRSSKSKPD